MKLNTKAFALSLGIVWGVIVFLLTNFSLSVGGSGEHLSRLALIYRGYSFSFVGSIVGLVWGFISMFIVGWVLAWLYNKFIGQKTAQ